MPSPNVCRRQVGRDTLDCFIGWRWRKQHQNRIILRIITPTRNLSATFSRVHLRFISSPTDALGPLSLLYFIYYNNFDSVSHIIEPILVLCHLQS
ncbi:hypothetical protein AKJ16_DCAP22379 [Drosera capensis]